MGVAPGTAFGPYEVLSFVGAGGMGEVYRARDTRLDRFVALKVLSSQLANDAEALGRFLREARTLSQLTHPNICTVYDVGFDGTTHYIVMEFLEGRTLAAHLQRGVMPIDQAVDYALQIADGLGKAHALGIIHRDLKPANVMLTTDGFIKILDFGLSKHFGIHGSTNTTMATASSGLVVGTIAYMAPEQTEGARADVRSDIFSFGVMLYEMLTGVRPFDGGNIVSTIRRINDEEPRPLHVARPDTPPALQSIIEQALHKNPQQRFQSVSEMRAQLRASAARSPVPGEAPVPLSTRQPRTTTADGRSWRTPLLAAAAAVILIAVAVAWSVTRPRDGASQADEPSAATDDRQDPVMLARQGQALLERHDRSQNVDQALALFNRLVVRDQQSPLAYAGLAQVYARKDAITPDPQWKRLALENARRAVELNADLTITQLAYGIATLRTGRRDESLQALNRARDLEPRNADVLRYLGEYYRPQDAAKAEEWYQAAATAAPNDWRTHDALARLYFATSNYEGAIAKWELARTLTPDNLLVLRGLGGAYHSVGRTDDAATAFQRALEIEPQATIYNNLATMRFFQGRFGDAAAAFEKATELNPTYYLYWGNLGDAYRWVPGKQQQAKDAYTTAIGLAEKRLEATPHDVDMRSSVAGYLAKRGDTERALAEVRTIEKTANRAPAIYYKTAIVNELAGRRDAALKDLEMALKGGYSRTEIENEAELVKLRSDARYHRLLTR